MAALGGHQFKRGGDKQKREDKWDRFSSSTSQSTVRQNKPLTVDEEKELAQRWLSQFSKERL